MSLLLNFLVLLNQTPVVTLPVDQAGEVAISRDGRSVVVGSKDGTLTLFRLILPTFDNPEPTQKYEKVGSASPSSRYPIQLAISADGRVVSAVYWDPKQSPRCVGIVWRPAERGAIQISMPTFSIALAHHGVTGFAFLDDQNVPSTMQAFDSTTGAAIGERKEAKSSDSQFRSLNGDDAFNGRGPRLNRSGTEIALRTKSAQTNGFGIATMDIDGQNWKNVPMPYSRSATCWGESDDTLYVTDDGKIYKVVDRQLRVVLSPPKTRYDTRSQYDIFQPTMLYGDKYLVAGVSEYDHVTQTSSTWSGDHRWTGFRIFRVSDQSVVTEIRESTHNLNLVSSPGGVVAVWHRYKEGVAIYDFRHLVPDWHALIDTSDLPSPIRVNQDVTITGRVVDQTGRPLTSSQIGVEDGIAKVCTTTSTDNEGKFSYKTRAEVPGVDQVTFIAPEGRRTSVWANVLPGDSYLPSMGLRSLTICNGSPVQQKVTVTVGNLSRSAVLEPGQEVKTVASTSIQEPFPMRGGPYAALTAGFYAGPAKVQVTVKEREDGKITTSLTAGALILRGKVYVDNKGDFGGCWAPGIDFGGGPIGASAEGFICLGTDGVKVGIGTGVTAGPATVGIEIEARPLGVIDQFEMRLSNSGRVEVCSPAAEKPLWFHMATR